MPSPPTAADRRWSRWRATRPSGTWLILVALAAAAGSTGVARSAFADPAGQQANGPSQGTTQPNDAEVQRKAQSIARQTMSPFCPGRTLSDCPSEYAAEWRRDIHEMVAQGDSAQQIQEELERRAGGDLSGSPHRDAGYGLSIGLAAAAVAVLFGLLRVLRSRQQDAGDGSTAERKQHDAPGELTDPTLDERLEQDLAAELDDDDDR